MPTTLVTGTASAWPVASAAIASSARPNGSASAATAISASDALAGPVATAAAYGTCASASASGPRIDAGSVTETTCVTLRGRSGGGELRLASAGPAFNR